jgi:hypothetical protein
MRPDTVLKKMDEYRATFHDSFFHDDGPWDELTQWLQLQRDGWTCVCGHAKNYHHEGLCWHPHTDGVLKTCRCSEFIARK